MPTIYQQETLESLLGLFLEGRGNSAPHHCSTKSESAISRFLNHYKWSTRSLIRRVRSCILNLILSQRQRGRKPTLQVVIDLTTLEKVGKFPHLQDIFQADHHQVRQQVGSALLAAAGVSSAGAVGPAHGPVQHRGVAG